MIRSIADLQQMKETYLEKMGQYSHLCMVCYGTGCMSSGCKNVRDAMVEELEKAGLSDKVAVIERGCMGTCAVGPVVYVLPDETYYTEMTPERVKDVVQKHFIGGEPVIDYTFYDSIQKKRVSNIHDVAFFRDQVRIALRNCGLIDVNCINSYVSKDGYLALARILEKGDRMAVIEEMKRSGLRGRGGAGFPTGVKWEAAYREDGDEKYIICNADEGDPGAFMDRSVFEGDPHSVIEGMLIGGYAIGANHGVVYIRAEYPIAVERLKAALEMAREEGVLGKDIFGSGFDFDIEIRIGAGAFVCGEETALMASVEGQRGEPRQKPPFPFQSGLFGKPTIINNVETLATVPAIMLNGADWFRQFGTEKSPGTKVFALSGNIVNTGLVEVPMGTPLSEVIYSIGGGIPNGKKFKSAQTGGPSGGCITAENINTPLDYESLAALGSIVGSGGLMSWTRTPAWWTPPGSTWTSSRRSPAANVPPAASAPSGCWRSSTASPTGKARKGTSRPWSTWARSSRTPPCAAWDRLPPTRCSPPSSTSGRSTRSTSWRSAVPPVSAASWSPAPARTPAPPASTSPAI